MDSISFELELGWSHVLLVIGIIHFFEPMSPSGIESLFQGMLCVQKTR